MTDITPRQGDRRFYVAYVAAVKEFGPTSLPAYVSVTAALEHGWSWSGLTVALIEGDDNVGIWPTQEDRRRRGSDDRRQNR
jgi:hypothetical protein